MGWLAEQFLVYFYALRMTGNTAGAELLRGMAVQAVAIPPSCAMRAWAGVAVAGDTRVLPVAHKTTIPVP